MIGGFVVSGAPVASWPPFGPSEAGRGVGGDRQRFPSAQGGDRGVFFAQGGDRGAGTLPDGPGGSGVGGDRGRDRGVTGGDYSGSSGEGGDRPTGG